MTKKHKFLKDDHIRLIEDAIEHKMFFKQRKGLRDLYREVWPTFFQKYEYDTEGDARRLLLQQLMDEDRELP